MSEIDTNEDALPILQKKTFVSRFQQSSNFANSGSERKRSLHIIKNQPKSKIARKFDFCNDQDTLTAFPDISSASPAPASIQTPNLQDLVNDFKARGFLKEELYNVKPKNDSGMSFDVSKSAIKSSFKNKKNSISQIEDENNFSNGSPLRPINSNTLNYQDGSMPQVKKTKFLQKSDRNNSNNSNLFDLSSIPSKMDNINNEKRQNSGNELGVKIIRPQNNQNFDANSTKTIDMTENDTYFNNLIQKDKLIDFGDIDNDVANESSFINNNSNNSLTTLPTKNKKIRKPLAPKVYDDEPKNKNDTSGASSALFPNNLNDDDTNTNNLNSIILPKKSVKFGGKNKNSAYEANNSIDTMFIAQVISKQPMLANLNPDETNTNMNVSFNLNQNSSMNGSINNSRKNNVRFVNSNKNNEFKETGFPNFNHENDEEDNDATKADIDAEFESEHSAILPPPEDHTIKFANSNNNNNYSTSVNNFIFTESVNPNSGILKKKNSSKSKLGSSILQGSGSFIANNNSKLGIDFLSNLYIDISPITECMNGLFSNQIASLSKNMKQKASNQLQLTNSILNRLVNTSIGNDSNIINIMNERKNEVSIQSSFFSLCVVNEILCELATLFEEKQLLCRKMMQSMKSLKLADSMATEELHRPIGTMKDVTSTIAKIEDTKKKNNDTSNDGSEFIQKYNLLKKSIPFKVSSLHSIDTQPGFNKDPNSILVSCSYRASQQKLQLNNSEMLHVKVSKTQRSRKIKEEMTYLMTLVPDFFFDGSKFSCVISSNDEKKDSQIRFAIVVDVPSFYPWCYLTVQSIRVDFGVTFEEVKEKIDSILNLAKISPHPLTDLVQALMKEFTL